MSAVVESQDADGYCWTLILWLRILGIVMQLLWNTSDNVLPLQDDEDQDEDDSSDSDDDDDDDDMDTDPLIAELEHNDDPDNGGRANSTTDEEVPDSSHSRAPSFSSRRVL